MFAQPASSALRLLQGNASTSANAPVTYTSPLANTVVAGVSEEIAALGEHNRPGLEAIAVALARVLDNPRATSTQPAAAAKLAEILNQLRKRHDGRKSRLAVVRAMTEKGGMDGVRAT